MWCSLHTANSTAALPGSVLGGSRTGPSGSVDDTYIANLIWDSPSHTDGGLNPSSLQKSPLHKSTSALTDLQDGGVAPTPQSSSNYQGHPHVTSPSSRSYTSEYYNTSTTYRPPEDLDLSPPPPTMTTRVHRNQSAGGLPDFNLTDEIFQHFARTRKQVTPPPSALSDYLPRHTTLEPQSQFPMPYTSSPIKRTSSPDLGLSMGIRGDQRARSNSPDIFLPTPEHHHRQQPVSHSYSTSHYPMSPGRNSHSNPPSRSNSKPNFRSGTTGTNPQPVTSPPYYDGMGTSYHQQPLPVHRHQHTDMPALREEGGAYHQGQQPPRTAAIPLPRRRNEESLDMQEFLQTLAESKTNPFNEGTLV